jgi:hypothetical protein
MRKERLHPRVYNCSSALCRDRERRNSHRARQAHHLQHVLRQGEPRRAREGLRARVSST